MEQELELVYERNSNLKLCRLCGYCIEDNSGRLVRLLCKDATYYHNSCLQLMMKKMERLSILYSS